jgi:hypothetical protein
MTGGQSANFYYESTHAAADWTSPSSVPQGWAVFNADPLIRRIMDPERKIAHWSEFSEGGHFPGMEAPELLLGDIRDFFRTVR